MLENRQKIINMDIDQVKNSLKSGSISVCVIGIGRIGMPTALSFAKSGLPTAGVDINKELVDAVNSGNFPLKDEPGYDVIFKEVISNKKFHATTNIEVASTSDVILLSLPTPMNEQNIPDYSALRLVGEQLNKLMMPGSLLIVESTIEPGFIENEFIKIIEGEDKRLIVGNNIGVGVCPETANPGEILSDFEKLPRLVASTNEKTTNMIYEIYKHVFPVDLIKMPNCKTANAVKLTTNVFRDINIAFVNELAILFEKLGIDIFQVLDAAKTKYNFQVHYPGAGVGGPCLPVNSYQMLNTGKKTGTNLLRIIKASREINEHMPEHVIELTKDAFNESNKSLDQSTVLILGVSYKPNVKDIQLTPAEAIVSKLRHIGTHIKIYDPHFVSQELFGIKSESNLLDAISQSDAVIIVTAHKEFLDIEPSFFASKLKSAIVIDARGVLDMYSAKKAGIIFRGVGRGNF